MARIPEEAIERVKRETDLVALVRSRGIELSRHGSKDFAGRCPFHEEGEGSFIVTPDLGLFHCMGCGAAGNAIQLVQEFDGVSFQHAYELLSEGEVAFSSASGTVRKCSTVSRLTPLVTLDTGDCELLGLVVDYYHECLLKTDAARDYLAGRGLWHDSAIERFKLGFADEPSGFVSWTRTAKTGRRSDRTWPGWGSCEKAATSTSRDRSPLHPSGLNRNGGSGRDLRAQDHAESFQRDPAPPLSSRASPPGLECRSFWRA